MTVDRYALLSGKRLLDPHDALVGAIKNHTPQDFWLKANSYSCPLGKEPGRAYVLLKRRDLVALARNGLHSLVWHTERGATTFTNLVIVRADCMNLSFNDPDSCYLVELADCRLQMQLSCINAQYNVRIPAPPATSGTDLYYPDSLNGGSLWTWQTMLTNIWASLPGIAGAAPTLPYTPSGSPEGYRFIGVSAWEAYNLILDKIGCAIALNPLTGVFSIVRRGTTQAGLAAAQAALNATHRMYTYDPLDSARADSPATVRVFFHKRAEDGHGTERDTPRTDNWEMNAVHSEDVATGITGAEAGTVLPVWDDLPAIVDEAGSLTNSSDLAARAAELAANIANQYSTESPYRTHYGGCHTSMLPGSEVSKVVWRDYSDGWDNAAGGLITEIHREAPEVKCGGLAVVGESLAGPDLGRHSHPVYPDLAQWLVVYHDSAAYGEFVEANSDGLHPGYVVRLSGDNVEYLERCWLLFEDNFETWRGVVLAVQEEHYGPGRLSGSYTSDGATYPIYRVMHGDRTWAAVNLEELEQDAFCEGEIWLYDDDADAWGPSGITWDMRDWFLNEADTLDPGHKLLVKWHGPILVITAAYCTPSDDPLVEASLPTG